MAGTAQTRRTLQVKRLQTGMDMNELELQRLYEVQLTARTRDHVRISGMWNTDSGEVGTSDEMVAGLAGSAGGRPRPRTTTPAALR